MKKILFTSTALAALAIGGVASAQGITLFGDARLGLGYNINNDGTVNGDEDVRAVSRVRMGFNATGETDTGITFGATIRADNAIGGQGGSNGQTAGEVFVSGSWGTLTLGDTSAADENWVGDIPGNLSLTGLGDLNETFYISNGGSFGTDNSNDFASNPTARPTIRYDFDIAGFGLSLSSNRDLSDIGVGAGYNGTFGAFDFGIGLGYYDFAAFTTVQEAGFETGTIIDGDGNEQRIAVPVAAISTENQGGEQYSAAITGGWESLSGGVVYTSASSSSAEFDTIGVGATYGFDAFAVGAYYVKILNADGEDDGLDAFDGEQTYGLTASYDLGGGAEVAGGIASTFGRGSAFGNRDLGNAETVADFGIKMAF